MFSLMEREPATLKKNQGGKPAHTARISTLLVGGSYYFFFFAAFFAFFLAAIVTHLHSIMWVHGCCARGKVRSTRSAIRELNCFRGKILRVRGERRMDLLRFLPCGNVHFVFFLMHSAQQRKHENSD